MPNTWDENRSDQKVPFPSRDAEEGSDFTIMTGQDGRIGYEPSTGQIDSLDKLRGMRNPRPVR